MDFNVKKIPKKVYSSNEERYIDMKQEDFFVSDGEKRLEDEIKAIKRLVPKEQRSKYFRNRNY